ncbi:MAG: hypothetical protein JXB14_04355 [Candidatus Altiarchaeota archaeon]|nr:hypothetical protein [Candidatus Altiarchaeota archaeon]
MEYLAKVKRIGGSSYLRLPPKLVRGQGLRDGFELTLRQSDGLIIMKSKKKKMDSGTLELIKSMEAGLDLDYKITRDEIYETDRY